MDYAIEVLENDKRLLEKCLSEWESIEYPEAKKQREKRLRSINNAINKIKIK
jgi:hypothetical protein